MDQSAPLHLPHARFLQARKTTPQLEKEALSLVFGVKNFHQYLYGRSFILLTDHQPLTTILDPKKGIPSLAAARLQRWAILLSAYKYIIKYKTSKVHGNADGLSKLPLPTTNQHLGKEDSIFNVCQMQALPVSFREIQQATRQDKLLGKVLSYTKTGWPSQVKGELMPYKSRANEIGIEANCLMWGTRVIVPEKLQARVLKVLHKNHPGISRMKAMARSYFWWHRLDKSIEDLAKSCTACQAIQASHAVAPLHPWVWLDTPWKRLHVDFAGPFMGKMFLIIIDAHSKWPEGITMLATTAKYTIDALWSVFAHFGLPEQLVSDNGPQFTSEEFAQFMRDCGTKHILCSPYHPSSNGLAERFVQTFKRAMRACEKDEPSLHLRLSEFLFSYRSTPHATTAITPSELFLQRRLRTQFDLLKPSTKTTVETRQATQKTNHDCHSQLRTFATGTAVMIKDFRHAHQWIPGTIVQNLGPLTYQVDIGDEQLVKCHIDHIVQRQVPSTETTTTSDCTDVTLIENNQYYPAPDPPHHPPAVVNSPPPYPPHQPPIVVNLPPPQPRYPQRVRKPPDRLMKTLAENT